MKAFEIAGVSSLNDFSEKLKTTVGQLYEGGYRPSETKRIYKPKDLSKIVGDPTKHNPDSIFMAGQLFLQVHYHLWLEPKLKNDC